MILDWLTQLSEELNNPNNTINENNDDFDINIFPGNGTDPLDPVRPTEDPWDVTFTPPTTISIPTLPPGVTGPMIPPGGNGTGDNGGAEISGDPHAMVWAMRETPICFNFFGDDHRFVDLLRFD